jgi:hypothetical protein
MIFLYELIILNFINMSKDSKRCEILYPPGEDPKGKSWEEWTKQWWKWLYAIPDKDNPVHDHPWQNAGSIPQPKGAFFLTGTHSDKAERKCKIPANTPVFFPIATMAASDAEFPGKNLRDLAKNGNQVDEMHLKIVDTKSKNILCALDTEDLKKYLVKTGEFYVSLCSDNICYWVKAKKRSRTMSHGYWAFLRPLSRGRYDIEFSQKTRDHPQSLTINCSYKVIYHIEV